MAAFRATRGRAISLYLDLDPSVAPTAGNVNARARALLHRARTSLGHEQRADLDRVEAWLESDFDRGGAQGFALFVDGADDLWRTLATPEPIGDEVYVGDELYLVPLVPLVGRSDGALVAAVGRERGDVYKLDAGRLVAIADRRDDTPGRHDQGGWSQARYERHIDELAARHLRRVADTLDRCVRELRDPRVVLVGVQEVRSEFEEMLANETRGCLIGWAAAEAHADPVELLAAARPVLDDWWAAREAALLDRWREAAAKNGRASTGWEETLAAVSDGRVDLLLVQSGADLPGLDAAIHETLANGGTVEVIRSRHDLEPVGGVAALLRY